MTFVQKYCSPINTKAVQNGLRVQCTLSIAELFSSVQRKQKGVMEEKLYMPGNCNFCIWSDIVASQNKIVKHLTFMGYSMEEAKGGDLKGESGGKHVFSVGKCLRNANMYLD